jgi:Cytochrome P460
MSGMLSNRILSAIALFFAIAFAQSALAQSPNVPKYSGDKLLFPDGFRSWMFVGSNLGLVYKGEPGPGAGKPAFHNVYITPEGYAGFRDTKTAFPDPTILVIDIYSAAKKEPHHILAKGVYDDKQSGALVAVKNSARPPGPNGEKTIWAYYIFPDISKPGASAAAQPDANCEACHKKNGLVDNVWVQFYPVLRDAMK